MGLYVSAAVIPPEKSGISAHLLFDAHRPHSSMAGGQSEGAGATKTEEAAHLKKRSWFFSKIFPPNASKRRLWPAMGEVRSMLFAS